MAKREKIFLYISDVASYIGQNKWDFITPFERLWKRCDKVGYQITLNLYKNEIAHNNLELAQLDQEIVILDQELSDKKITKRQHTIAKKNILLKYENIQNKVNTIQQKVDDIDLTQQQKLEKVVGKSIINKITDSSIETSNKRDTVNTILQNIDLPKEKLQTIKQQAESFINKSHGTIKENDAIQMYQSKYNVQLDTSQEFYKRQLNIANSNYEWYVCGKMDGVYKDPESPENNYIVEVKNRTKNFFSTLRDYEKTQIQMYIWIADYTKARLVEKHENKLRVTSIYKDAQYIDDILEYLKIFINNFEQQFLQNDDQKLKYIKNNNDGKQLFLKNLYLNHISKYIRDKMEIDEPEDQDCMIDDLD